MDLERAWARRGALLLYLGQDSAELLVLAAALALEGGAVVLDGGNRFNAYRVIHAVRRQTAALDCLDSLSAARAFICHQMPVLCRQVPLDGRPALVLDMLGTFEDEGVPLHERLRLLRQSLSALAAVRRQAFVVVGVHPPKHDPAEYEQMLAVLRRTASGRLEEGFMGKTLPTINQIIQESEAILTRFWRVLQPEEKELLRELFAKAKRHVAAISEANHLLPFEAVQQAMLLEQAKEIEALKRELEELKRRLDG